MRRKKFVFISALLFSGLLCGIAPAEIVVDTGPGPSSGDAWFFDSIHRGVAGKFTTTQAWTISSVETWMEVGAGGQAVAIIYNDDAGGDVPGTRRFSQSFTATANPAAAWRGASGLNWSLPAGTYWVGFAVENIGIQGVLYSPVPNPLAAYAAQVLDNPWFSLNLAPGFRIQSGTTPRPSGPSVGAIDILLLD